MNVPLVDALDHVFRFSVRDRGDVRAVTFTDESFHHVPVLRDEVVEAFAAVPAGAIIDATCGGAGHAAAILESRSDLTLIGLDRDQFAVEVAQHRLARFGNRASVRHLRFDAIRTAVDPTVPVTGVLFDLGVSSAQFDIAERGFSYRFDAPLDMRMDTSSGPTAAEIVNGSTPAELRHLISKYGDERFADRIARAIVAHRPIHTTAALAEIVTAAIPAATRRTGGHPAKRTFQALRIEVNDELRVLAPAIDAAIDVLAPSGRLVVLSYHSGEDRIVKDRFRFAETGGCSCPSDLPCVCGALPRGRMVRRGVLRASPAEQARNPRATSVVARIFEKAGPAGTPDTATVPRSSSRRRAVSDSKTFPLLANPTITSPIDVPRKESR